ncbi:MAG: prolyl oligopeptidase family serine peptidase [Rhodothalassiaceae bacterium]
MRSIMIVCGLVSAGLPGLSAQEQDTRFSADHVFDLEYANNPQISPDGATIVYERRSMDRTKDVNRSDLWVVEVATGAQRPVVTGGASAGTARFSPDGRRLLYLTSEDGKPVMRIRYMDTGENFSVAQLQEAPRQPVWSPDGSQIAFTMFVPGEAPAFASPPKQPKGADWAPPVKAFDDMVIRFDGAGYLREGASHIFVVSAQGGSPRQVTAGEADFSAPAWLDEDTLLVVGNGAEDRDLDPIENEIYAVELADLSRTALTSRDGPDERPEASPDGTLIAYTGYDDERRAYQQTELYVMGADGADPRRLTGDFDRSIGGFVWHPNGQSLIAQVGNRGDIELVSVSLDGEVETLLTGLGGTSIGRPYAGAAFSVSDQDRPVIAYTHNAGDRPAELAVRRPNGETQVLTDLNGDLLDYLAMARVEEITVPSSHDGREIQAWVALPPDFEPNGSFPMILEIHGGPFAMYGPHFSAEVQRYAAEGYVTVFANPRGSTGYGEDFAQLIDQNYPGEDYDDLMSVVDALIERQWVDPDRLFVTGGSGGGVLTAWIVGKTDRFAAAATIKPVINWLSMALTADIGMYVKRHWIRAEPWENPEAFWEHSPLRLVGEVSTPTLVMVGEEDWRTPSWEAEQFYFALKQRQVPTALIRVPEASHSIARRPSALIGKVDNIMGWFERHDPAETDKNAQTVAPAP